MLTSAFKTLDAVAAHLPFHLNDTEQANLAFRRWREQNQREAKRLVDLWTYCFVRRYFLTKFMQDPAPNVSDFDALVERTYLKIEKHRASIQDPGRYAHWVSVVCKNTFLNHLRRRRKTVSIDDPSGLVLAAEERTAYDDLGLVLQALTAAILRLPLFLQEVARLRLLEDCSYEEISDTVGKPLPIIRSYVNKALKRLRQDAQLLVLWDPLYGEHLLE